MSCRFVLFAVLTCTLAACGGESSRDAGAAAGSYTPPGPGECPMVGNADATVALGMPVTFNPNEYSASTCNLAPEPTTYGIGTIVRMEGFELQQQLGQSYPSLTPVEVNGLGDGAAWVAREFDGTLLVQRGSDLYTINLAWNQAGANADAELHRTRAVALARAVLSNA